MPILSANRIGGVLKDIHYPKLGASTFGVGAFCLIRYYHLMSDNSRGFTNLDNFPKM